MPNVLTEILAHKRREVEQARAARPAEWLRSRPGYILPCRNFYGAVMVRTADPTCVAVPRGGGPNLIAEIKRSSPSAGLIRPDFEPVAISRQYAEGGAQALSILTDEKFFGGRIEYIEAVKAAVGLPVLRKDFLVDAYQIHESRACGADAVLLIAEALAPSTMVELVTLARSLGLWVLLEVHTQECLLDVSQRLGDKLHDGILLGINNRDLQTQRVDLATAEELARLVPRGVPIVAESGIRTRADVERMLAAGARAVLVGEVLMRSGDPRQTIEELFG